MTEALDAAQRTSLEKLVLRCRHLLETDLAQELERRYGIHKSGVIEAETSLTLDASALESRRDLESVVVHLRSEGESARGSVERLVREAAFTHLNRLVAVRIAEAIGMLPQTLSGGIEAAGFRDFREMAPLVGSDDWDRYRLFLGLCADELAADVPALFDPRNPVLVLQPSTPTLVDLVGTISTVPAAVWDAPDTLGWVYQFFNTGEERRAMRASGAPRDSRELAVRNQFFTPRYVVDFLVQNGLGAHLASGVPDLADQFPYLVETPTEGKQVDLREVSVLDPACGSGHFLLGAYDVLELAWDHEGVPPSESAPAIISSLWGIDIDPRCTQIAQAAIVFRARRQGHLGDLPLPNVICARALPTGPEADALIASLPDGIGVAVGTIAAELETAPLLGPLLKIEERLEHEIRSSVFGGSVVEGTLAEGLEGDALAVIEIQVLEALSALSNASTSTAAERLFAAEATDAFRFVEAMRRRYTAVVMNPPFGEPIPETKTYLKSAYPWIPAKDSNILAAFVGRGLELADANVGTCGAITSRAGFFQSTYESWRRDVVLANDIRVFADLGSDVMEQALVEAAAYVLGKTRPAPNDGRHFIRVLAAQDKQRALAEGAAAAREGRPDPNSVFVPLSDFADIPGFVLLYWDPGGLRGPMTRLPSLSETIAQARQGLITGDDFRFVRMWWEGTHDDEVWFPLTKGGEYSPYFRDVEFRVNWANDGEAIRSTGRSARVQGVENYGSAGITWVERTNSAFAPAYLPGGVIFTATGPLVPVADENTQLSVLAWLASRPVRWFVESTAAAGEETKTGGTAARHYTVGLLQAMPVPPDIFRAADLSAGISDLAREIVGLVAELFAAREPSTTFRAPGLLYAEGETVADRLISRRRYERDIVVQVLERHGNIDRALLGLVGVEDSQDLNEICGPNLSALPHSDEADALISQWAKLDTKHLIREVGERIGLRRWVSLNYHVVDRRLELMSAGSGVHPAEVARVLNAEERPSDADLSKAATDVVSYLMGCEFGRWPVHDAEVVRVPVSGSHPVGRPDGFLVDEPGHELDVVHRLRNNGGRVLGEKLLESLEGQIPYGDLRRYLRSRFFVDHLEMYKSGSSRPRYAPIYWYLSVPSRAWGLWVLASALRRETLFAISRESARRERLAHDLVSQLETERSASAGVRSVAVVAREIEAEAKLAEELRLFGREAERIAGLGWVPDLDDGIPLNAAPLATLFPAWKKAAEYRDELRAGEHKWATVARWGGLL